MDVTVIHADGLEVTGSINGDTKELGSAPVRFDGLEVEKEYVLTVVVTDGDRSKEKQFKIVIPVSEEEAFKQKASQFVRDITLTSDGEVNSGKVWILVSAPDSGYKVTATVEKETKELKDGKARFDDMGDNTTYKVSFKVTDGTYTYQGQRDITAPNRTAPKVDNISISGNEMVIEVTSKSKIQN